MWNDGVKQYTLSGLDRDEEIKNAIERILRENTQPTKYEIGVYTVFSGHLSHYYGQQGCCELIRSGGEVGWQKIGYSLTCLFCEFISSSAAGFPTKYCAIEVLSLLYFASVASGSSDLERAIVEIIRRPLVFGIEESWWTHSLTSLTNFAVKTNYPCGSHTVNSRFSPMLSACDFDSRQNAINDYLDTRRDLVDSETIPTPFSSHPFILLPIELFVFRDWLEEYSQQSRSGLKKFFLAEKPQFKFEFNDELRQIYDIICAKSRIDLRIE